MYFPLIGYNLPADYSRISVNFFLYQYLLDVATVSSSTLLKFTTHFRNNTATHVFQIQQLNKFNFHLNLLRCFSCELLLCQETSRKKSQEFRLGLRGDQNLPQLWQPGKRVDLTRLPKSVFKKSSTTFAVWGLTSSCINPWIYKGKVLPKVVSRCRSGASANIVQTAWVRVLIKVLADLAVVGHDNPKGDFLSMTAFSWSFFGRSVRQNRIFCLLTVLSKQK